jgi:hypothetical protein
MRSLGYRVQFIDFNIQLYQWCKQFGCGDLWHNWRYFKAWNEGQLNLLANLIDSSEIRGEVVGLSVGATSLAFTVALAGVIRKRFPRKKVIWGGHGVFLPSEVAAIPLTHADAICRGEGEYTLRDVMERGFKNLGEVPGLYLPDEPGWRLTSERELIRDLDSIPWPTYEWITLDHYDTRFLPVVGSRGCINCCNYCYDRYMMHGRYRTRSAVNLVDEIEYLNQRYHVDHFPYNDALMNGHVGVMEKRADEILRRGLQVEYWGNFMIRDDMSDDLLRKLRRSGFSIALIGVESGSAATLKGMRKRHTPELAAAFVRRCHDAGIRTELNFIVGFPTETEEHFEETLRFIRENRKHIDMVLSATTCSLYPSDLLDHIREYGIVIGKGDPQTSWNLRDGSNTYDARLQRLYRLLDLCNELGLSGQQTMTDAVSDRDEFPSVMDKIILNYIAHWRDKRDSTEGERADAMAAARFWLKRMRNRRIAQFLDRFGLLGPAMKARQLLKRKTE